MRSFGSDDSWDLLLELGDQDQDSLLVKRRNDNHSPGGMSFEFFIVQRGSSIVSSRLKGVLYF